MRRFVFIANLLIFTFLAYTLLVRWINYGGITFEEDYAQGKPSGQWVTHALCCGHSFNVVTSPVRSGEYAARFEIRYNDPDIYDAKRAELIRPHQDIGFILGPDEWYGFSLFLPQDFGYDKTHEIVAQWHARKDSGEIPRYPPLSLRTQQGQWRLVAWHHATAIQKENGKRVTLWQGPYQTGIWTDWVVHVKWDYRALTEGGNGFIEVWQRVQGEKWQMIADYRGPNSYNDQENIYFQWGAYKPAWKDCDIADFVSECSDSELEKRVVYNDRLRIANAGSFAKRFHKVAPK